MLYPNIIIKIPYIGRKVVYPFLVRHEGGEKTSKLARECARKNNVEIGLYSYGGYFFMPYDWRWSSNWCR